MNNDPNRRDERWPAQDRLAAEDRLDGELDAALARYAAVEPRAGLEARVLARLQSEREAEQMTVADRGWWRWGVMAAVGVAILVAIALAFRPVKPVPDIARKPPLIPAQSGHEEKRVASNQDNQAVDQERTVRPKSANARKSSHPQGEIAAAQVKVKQPRLEQFPAPQPMSEQEKMLANYVAEDPERAVLLARAQAEALRRDELEERKKFPTSDATNSEEASEPITNR